MPSSPTTQRIYGADRYSTAVAVARAQIATTGTPVDGFVIASGEAPYDALAASLLTTDDRPMVLVKKDSVPESVSDLFSDYKALLAAETTPPRVYVVGGENAISKATLDAITAALVTAGDLTPRLNQRGPQPKTVAANPTAKKSPRGLHRSIHVCRSLNFGELPLSIKPVASGGFTYS